MQMKLKLSVAAALAAIAGMASAQDVQVVKIGHVAPVSGAQAHYGKDNENGARMAIEELNTQNIVIGGKKIKLNCRLKTTQLTRNRARLLHRNCATPRSLAWWAT